MSVDRRLRTALPASSAARGEQRVVTYLDALRCPVVVRRLVELPHPIDEQPRTMARESALRRRAQVKALSRRIVTC
jgi:hypothetical protein